MLFCVLLLGAAGCETGGTAKPQIAAKSTEAPANVEMSAEEMAKKEGIPIYPGSQTPSGESSVTSGAGETRYELVMVTSDSINKVADFYRQKIAGLDGKVTGDTADFMGMAGTNIPVHITAGVRNGKTNIRAAAILENPPSK